MRSLPHFAIFLIGFLTVSCAHYAPQVDRSFIPDPKTVVLYGRFKFTDNTKSKNDDSFFVGYRMALRLFNEDTQKSLFIRFSKNSPLSCVHAGSGHYHMIGLVVTDGADAILHEKPFQSEGKYTVTFKAEPNLAIYLGDFSGYANVQYYGIPVPQHFEMGTTQVTNNVLETTREFREKYPNLLSLPVQSVFGP